MNFSRQIHVYYISVFALGNDTSTQKIISERWISPGGGRGEEKYYSTKFFLTWQEERINDLDLRIEQLFEWDNIWICFGWLKKPKFLIANSEKLDHFFYEFMVNVSFFFFQQYQKFGLEFMNTLTGIEADRFSPPLSLYSYLP